MKLDNLHPLIFIVGGARSGKSRYGEELIKTFPSPRTYIATAEIFDKEMARRVEKHKAQRAGIFSGTIEEPLNLSSVIRERDEDETLFIDCLSVFLGNLFHYKGIKDSYSELDELYIALSERKNPIIIISNEVGEGIVPDNELARYYRDMSGWMNQKVASLSTVAIKMNCGIPQLLKGELI